MEELHSIIKWIDKVKAGLPEFLPRFVDDDYKYCKYSLTGDIYKRKDNWGLGNMVFAVRIMEITGIIKQLDKSLINNMAESILNYYNNGYIHDPMVIRPSFVQKLRNILRGAPNVENIKRAETRQSLATLDILGRNAPEPFGYIPANETEIDEYFDSFDWSHPWGSGSHISHLLFFLKYNARFSSKANIDIDKLIRHTIGRIEKLQHKSDGCWYKGSQLTMNEKINGAMKILTAYHAAGITDVPYAKKIIDTALLGVNNSEACGNFNIVYMLYGTSYAEPEYRKNEIEDFLLDRLQVYKEHYYPDLGGFSFYKNRANEVYYGMKISQGKDEPDIHGTAMFLWGIALINHLLNLEYDLKIPIH